MKAKQSKVRGARHASGEHTQHEDGGGLHKHVGGGVRCGLHKHLTRSDGALEAMRRTHDGPKNVRVWQVTHVSHDVTQGAAHSTVGRWWGQWGRSTDTPHTGCDHDSEATQTHTRTWEQR